MGMGLIRWHLVWRTEPGPKQALSTCCEIRPSDSRVGHVTQQGWTNNRQVGGVMRTELCFGWWQWLRTHTRWITLQQRGSCARMCSGCPVLTCSGHRAFALLVFGSRQAWTPIPS